MTENKEFKIRRDEMTNELYVELSDSDLRQFQAGQKADKSPKVYMTTPSLVKLNDVMAKERKQFFIGNEDMGYQKVNPLGIKHTSTIGIFT